MRRLQMMAVVALGAAAVIGHGTLLAWMCSLVSA